MNSGIKAELAAIRTELKQQAGRDVNSGLSSRGITFIALALIAAWAVARWDSDRRNKRVTERALCVSKRISP